MTKASDKNQLKDTLQSTSSVCLKMVKVIKNKESLRNSHCQDELKEMRWLNALYLAWEPVMGREYQVKFKEIWIKYAL